MMIQKHIHTVVPDGSVGTTTTVLARQSSSLGVISNWGQKSSSLARRSCGTAKVTLAPGVKRPVRQTPHLPLSSAAYKNVCTLMYACRALTWIANGIFTSDLCAV